MPEIVPDAIPGVESFLIRPKGLDVDLRISIGRPARPAFGAQGDGRLPVFYVTDADYCFGTMVEAVRMACYAGEMAPAVVVGIGLSGWYGLQWYQLPTYSDADIDASAELNLQLDLQRQPGTPDAAALASLRAKTRADVVADIERERHQVETGLGAGLIALVAACGNFVLMALLREK